VTILVDRPRWPKHGHRFAHLVSDTSLEELHAFAARLPLERPLRFHRDHYDVAEPVWSIVVNAGARVVTAREIVQRLRAAGLRARRDADDCRPPNFDQRGDGTVVSS
jgi:hypothetical protein